MEVNYRYNSKNENKKKDVIELFKNKEYGTLVLYEEIAELTGYNPDDEEQLIKMKSFVGNLKDYLIRYGIILKSIKNTGWYILKPSQISSFTYRNYILNPIKKYEKANEILKYFDKTKLSKDRTDEYNKVNNLNNELSEATEKILFESKYYKNKTYYDNLEV